MFFFCCRKICTTAYEKFMKKKLYNWQTFVHKTDDFGLHITGPCPEPKWCLKEVPAGREQQSIFWSRFLRKNKMIILCNKFVLCSRWVEIIFAKSVFFNYFCQISLQMDLTCGIVLEANQCYLLWLFHYHINVISFKRIEQHL